MLASAPLPVCAVLLSPGVDCTLESLSMVDNRHNDPMLSLHNLLALRDCYAQSPELYTRPDLSPLFLQAGSSEILRDEAMRAAQRAFQMASFLPEAAQAIDQIVAFVCARAGWKPAPPTVLPIGGDVA